MPQPKLNTYDCTSSSDSKDDIPLILKRALTRLQSQDRDLSLRWLASHLGMSASYVSKIFRGEKKLSLKLLPKLANILQLDIHEVADIQQLLLASIETRAIKDTTGIRTIKSTPGKITSGYKSLGVDDFWLLDEWYYLPILNLATTTNFKSSEAWIAKSLGITLSQAKDAVQKLVDSAHLQRDENGQLSRTEMKIRFPTQRSHKKIRSFHSKMFNKAALEIEKVPSGVEFSRRLLSGMSFAADPNKVAEAKLLLEKAAFQAAQLLSEGECTEVFQLNLQLFSLTRNEDENA